MADPRIQEAISLMMGFAERSGLSSDDPQHCYLWTDASASLYLFRDPAFLPVNDGLREGYETLAHHSMI